MDDEETPATPLLCTEALLRLREIALLIKQLERRWPRTFAARASFSELRRELCDAACRLEAIRASAPVER